MSAVSVWKSVKPEGVLELVKVLLQYTFGGVVVIHDRLEVFYLSYRLCIYVVVYGILLSLGSIRVKIASGGIVAI